VLVTRGLVDFGEGGSADDNSLEESLLDLRIAAHQLYGHACINLNEWGERKQQLFGFGFKERSSFFSFLSFYYYYFFDRPLNTKIVTYNCIFGI
jgi:hypothetical protein